MWDSQIIHPSGCVTSTDTPSTKVWNMHTAQVVKIHDIQSLQYISSIHCSSHASFMAYSLVGNQFSQTILHCLKLHVPLAVFSSDFWNCFSFHCNHETQYTFCFPASMFLSTEMASGSVHESNDGLFHSVHEMMNAKCTWEIHVHLEG